MAECQKWTKESLDVALQRVKSGELSQNRAAILYGIPLTTLHDHVHGNVSKVGAGRPTVLTYEEEREIVYSCQVSTKLVEEKDQQYYCYGYRFYKKLDLGYLKI